MRQTGIKKNAFQTDSNGNLNENTVPIAKAIAKYLTQKQIQKQPTAQIGKPQQLSNQVHMEQSKSSYKSLNATEQMDKVSGLQYKKENSNKDRKTQTHLKARNSQLRNNFFGNNTDECRIINSVESSDLRADSEEKPINGELLPNELKQGDLKRFQIAAGEKVRISLKGKKPLRNS